MGGFCVATFGRQSHALVLLAGRPVRRQTHAGWTQEPPEAAAGSIMVQQRRCLVVQESRLQLARRPMNGGRELPREAAQRGRCLLLRRPFGRRPFNEHFKCIGRWSNWPPIEFGGMSWPALIGCQWARVDREPFCEQGGRLCTWAKVQSGAQVRRRRASVRASQCAPVCRFAYP